MSICSVCSGLHSLCVLLCWLKNKLSFFTLKLSSGTWDFTKGSTECILEILENHPEHAINV